MYIMYLGEQADPLFKIADYASLPARPFFESTRTQCFMDTATMIKTENMSQAKMFTADPTEAMAKLYPLMAYSTLKVKGPVFMGTGGKDKDVPPPGTGASVRRCVQGGQRDRTQGLRRSRSLRRGQRLLANSAPFVEKAFAGEAITGNCPKGSGVEGDGGGR